MFEKQYYVYILTRARNSTFYTGVTNDLIRRVWEHRKGLADGFTKKYGVHHLVYYEVYGDINLAIAREKLIKKWRREIKIEAIEKMNPRWNDLYAEITESRPDPVMRRGDKF